MLIRLRTNIGTRDCDIIPPLMEGQERDVDKATGTKLVARGLAEDITPEPEPTPEHGTVEKATADLVAYREREIRAIPEPPAVAVAKPPEIAPKEPEPKKPVLKVKSKDKESQ